MVRAASSTAVARERRPAGLTDSGEARFYARYGWCLNPLLTLEHQLGRLGEELEHAARLPAGWQRDECAINVYLLACGIACTVDDYLGRRRWDLALIAERLPRLRVVTPALRWLLGLPHAMVKRVRDHPVRQWRDRWGRCAEMACEMLVGVTTPEHQRWAELRSICKTLSRTTLPPRLLQRRLRIPEGFRCQDLSHHDVLALARRFAERHADRRRALVVIGVRTAGAYCAPLVKAYLATVTTAPVRWLTIRPREGLTGPERRQLRKLARGEAQALVIDDHPNTGRSLTLVLTALKRCGVRPERITILTPRHPVQPDWALPRNAPGADRVAVITLEPEETYKARMLTPAAVAPLLRDWFSTQGWQRVVVRASPQVDAINARLADHCRDGFQVRLQRLFEVELSRDTAEPLVLHVVAKSVGWGWLGYHAYLAGTRLRDFVPPVIGLRHGLLFSQWVGELSDRPASSLKVPPVTTLAAYIARRTECLPLREDPGLQREDFGWDGWEMLLGLLRRAYGPYYGRLKRSALRQTLGRFAGPQPILVDGRMRPSEWLATSNTLYKLDYEHHNFGPAELNVADPACDLASAIFEFRLDERAESELLEAYGRESGDRRVSDRVLLYKLLHGTFAMQQAATYAPRAGSASQRSYWNGRYLAGRDFLAYQVHRLCAGLLPPRPPPARPGPLFFLDLDGVFDCDVLGFPHTTASGLAALHLLRAHGFTVVLNTGRSAEHVRKYCDLYGLPGGVAEYGSVFVDAVGGRDLVFPSSAALEQLERCRDALRTLPGVCVDEAYRYAVRGYRYEGGGTVSLPASEVRQLLSRPQLRGLAGIVATADTYIVPQGITKGSALVAVKQLLGCREAAVVAMGDSDEDASMLQAADSWYAPADCSPRLRALAATRRGRITARPKQRGFLEAVQDLVRQRGASVSDVPRARQPERIQTVVDLVATLLHVVERSRLSQFLATCTGRGL